MAISNKIKKNLLDLNYNKYLQYYNTAIILLFTYLTAISIVFLTRQIDFGSSIQLLVAVSLSFFVISILILFPLHFKEHLKKITKEIRKLDY